jgi:hypothetical protein
VRRYVLSAAFDEEIRQKVVQPINNDDRLGDMALVEY